MFLKDNSGCPVRSGKIASQSNEAVAILQSSQEMKMIMGWRVAAVEMERGKGVQIDSESRNDDGTR